MSAVLFKFTQPDGTPVADAPFLVTTRKASFDEMLDHGIQLPGDVHGLTDENGEATLNLVSGFGTYHLSMVVPGAAADPEGCISGLRFRFVVPEATETLRVEDLIVTTPTWSRPWDEVAVAVIVEAKGVSQAAAAESKASAAEARESADFVQASVDAVVEAAARADDAADRAAGSIVVTEANAKRAEDAATVAGQHKDQAATFVESAETAQAGSEAARDQSQAYTREAEGFAQAASGHSDTAAARVSEAEEFANKAKLSADAAAGSVTAAGEAAGLAEDFADAAEASLAASDQNKQATAADVLTSTALKGDTKTLRDEAKVYRDEAMAAAGSLAGAIVDGGFVDLSGGVYPPTPIASTFWKVTVGGTIVSDGETYGVGDSLFYTLNQNLFYKVDHTESVSSVAGFTGVITKGDLGIDKLDNTPDSEKPVSTPQQAELNKKLDNSSVVNNLTSASTEKPLAAAQGKVLAEQIVAATAAQRALTQGGTLTRLTNVQGTDTLTATAPAPYDKFMASSKFDFIVPNTNTGPVTININGVGQVEITKAGTTPLAPGDLKAGSAVSIISDGSRYQLNAGVGGGGSPEASANITRFTYNVSPGQTIISGNDLSGVPLAYTVGVPFFVDMNGFPIWLGNDYAATTGNTIVLTTAAEEASEIAITVFKAKTVNDTYTKAEIDGKIGNSALPVGLTVPWSLSEATIPGGMLPQNGQLVSRAVWPTLWALVKDQAVTDAVWLAAPYLDRGKFSLGDGATNFRMPDLNGKHTDGFTPAAAVLRGYGKNSAGTPGLFQLDQFQNITGQWAPYSATGHIATGSPDPTGAFKATGELRANAISAIASAGTKLVSFDASGSPGARAGTETRGTNVTVIWCIVAATALQNIGTLDVLALANKVTTLEGKVAALETGALQYEVETLWTGSVGNAGVVCVLSRKLRAGDLIFIRHTDANQLVSAVQPVSAVGTGQFVYFTVANVFTGANLGGVGKEDQIIFQSYISGFGVAGIYAIKPVKK